MTYDDDTLMAYADGELDPQLRAEIAQALQSDPAMAAAVARFSAQRRDVFAAFADVLDEPVPSRLQPRAPATVLDLEAARSARATPPLQASRSWPQWGALAASLAIGVLAGSLGAGWLGQGGALAVAGKAGSLTAGGELREALDRQLAGEPVTSGVRVGLSFMARDGSYCRTFQLGVSAGLACRAGRDWHVPVLAAGAAQRGEYRQAGAELPAAVLDAVDARIVGSTLDAATERAARDRHWLAPAPGAR